MRSSLMLQIDGSQSGSGVEPIILVKVVADGDGVDVRDSLLKNLFENARNGVLQVERLQDIVGDTKEKIYVLRVPSEDSPVFQVTYNQIEAVKYLIANESAFPPFSKTQTEEGQAHHRNCLEQAGELIKLLQKAPYFVAPASDQQDQTEMIKNVALKSIDSALYRVKSAVDVLMTVRNNQVDLREVAGWVDESREMLKKLIV